ncbi:MAG: MBL fold metallo-hydrolase [gamma proteobacterium symbiont of Bathyaustriella thionipta]|nr:MBL fold metallo-hydrolase [gamma proteobacterium symbiont of Bathyaustriella thionipta]
MKNRLLIIRWFCWLLLSLSWPLAAECLPQANISLQVLGSGGPEINDGRASSGYLVWQGDKALVLLDAGSGTALNFEKSGADLNDLQAVLFTHFHVDHSVDFPAFVKASYFSGRDSDLPVFGPAGNALMPSASEFIRDLLGSKGAYRYLQEYLLPQADSDYKIRVTDVPLQPIAEHHYQLKDNISVSAV